MELFGRLLAIAGFVSPGGVVADIGTDHARLPIYLVLSGNNPAAIASDINKGPYEAARQAVKFNKVEDKVQVRLGDGMRVLKPGEADVVVMAGMGGNTIRGIIENTPTAVLDTVKRLVLQPMADAGELRLWLAQNGWLLADETLVKEEERIYSVIAAESGEEITGDKLLLEIGPRLVEKRDPLLPQYLHKLKGDYQRVLSALARTRNPDAQDKAIKLTAKLAKICEVGSQCQ